MTAGEKQISALRTRLVALVVWNACFWTATGWCFLCGATVLLCRILERPVNGLWLWALAGLLVSMGIAAIFSARRWPSVKGVAALMDARLEAGGLLMAAESGQARGWNASSAPLSPRWQGGVPGLVLLSALSFLVLATYVPLAQAAANIARPLEIDTMLEKLEERVELLEEIGLIEEEQTKEWSTLMKALRQDSSGLDPAATWEALDELADRVEDAAAVEVVSRRREVEKREELIAALKAAMQAYEDNREQADAAMQELSDLLSKASETNPSLKALLEGLPEFGMQQVAAGVLTMEEAQMLAERMAQMTEEDLERMRQMLEQGMCQQSACSRPGNTESLKKFLEENPGCTNLMACVGMAPGRPGNGGINRGPGTAPISWLGETSEEGVDFTEEVLKPSMLDSLADSEMVGESFGAPEVDAAAAGSTGGVLTGKEASDSAATVHAVLPRHRDAVDRFFMRNEEE